MSATPNIEEIFEAVSAPAPAADPPLNVFDVWRRVRDSPSFTPKHFETWCELIGVYNRLMSAKKIPPKGTLLTSTWRRAMNFMVSGKFIYALCLARLDDRNVALTLMEYLHSHDPSFRESVPQNAGAFVLAHLLQNESAFFQPTKRLRIQAKGDESASQPLLTDNDDVIIENVYDRPSPKRKINSDGQIVVEVETDDDGSSFEKTATRSVESGSIRPVGDLEKWFFTGLAGNLSVQLIHLNNIIAASPDGLNQGSLDKLRETTNLDYRAALHLLNKLRLVETEMQGLADSVIAENRELRRVLVESEFDYTNFFYETLLRRLDEIASEHASFAWPPPCGAQSEIATNFETAMLYLNRALVSMQRPTIDVADVPNMEKIHRHAVVALYERVVSFGRVESTVGFAPSSRSMYANAIVGMALSAAKLIALNK